MQFLVPFKIKVEDIFYYFSLCKRYKGCTSNQQNVFISPFVHKVEEWYNKARASKGKFLNSLENPQFTVFQEKSITEKYLDTLLILTLSGFHFVLKIVHFIKIVRCYLCMYYKHSITSTYFQNLVEQEKLK